VGHLLILQWLLAAECVSTTFFCLFIYVCVHLTKIKCHRTETKTNTPERRPISGLNNSDEKKELRTFEQPVEHLWQDRKMRIDRSATCISHHPMVQHSPVGQGLLITEASRSHPDTLQLVRLIWTSDQPVAEIPT